jgi:hypothetical protein
MGRQFNSRRLSVGLLPYKRERLAILLRHWMAAPSYSLLEIAQLLGTLENHTKYARWARCWFSALQNHVRQALHVRYQKKKHEITNGLPPGVFRHCLEASPALKI